MMIIFINEREFDLKYISVADDLNLFAMQMAVPQIDVFKTYAERVGLSRSQLDRILDNDLFILFINPDMQRLF